VKKLEISRNEKKLKLSKMMIMKMALKKKFGGSTFAGSSIPNVYSMI
jgi:hypothetical protein